jgi:hypothetical protein
VSANFTTSALQNYLLFYTCRTAPEGPTAAAPDFAPTLHRRRIRTQNMVVLMLSCPAPYRNVGAAPICVDGSASYQIKIEIFPVQCVAAGLGVGSLGRKFALSAFPSAPSQMR